MFGGPPMTTTTAMQAPRRALAPPFMAPAQAHRPVPEYLQRMVKETKYDRLARQAQQPGGVAEASATTTPIELEVDTPPHVIPFAARALVLNLCPPHGHALPPAPPKQVPAASSRRAQRANLLVRSRFTRR